MAERKQSSHTFSPPSTPSPSPSTASTVSLNLEEHDSHVNTPKKGIDHAPSDIDLLNVTPSTGVSQQNLKSLVSSDGVDSQLCQICKSVYDSVEDLEKDSPWLGCEEIHCQYWVHTLCIGLMVTLCFQKKNWILVSSTS